MLNYAEAVVESGLGDTVKAPAAMNATRRRAAFMTPIPLTLQIVMRERKVEMSFAFVKTSLNRMITPAVTFTIAMDLNSFKSWTQLREGDQYYFRIGTVSSATSAKYNYTPPVKLTY